ncbi:MAG: tyrosine-type recombinase/integrase [Anaerolineales bacterium]
MTATLLQYLFGESASAAEQGASPRLLLWCRAFDDWLEERRRKYTQKTWRASMVVSRRLMQLCGKLPWELEQADVVRYIEWMQEQGYPNSTICYDLGVINNFYRWCDRMRFDPQCEAGFNPVQGVERPKVRNSGQAKALSLDEVWALLEILRQDPAILSKRDYAFFLTRLLTGVKPKYIQQLQWRQVELDPLGGAWVHWGETKRHQRLPQDVWQAIEVYLQAAGRLESMRPQAYVFTPLVDPLRRVARGQAEDWNDKRYLSSRQILAILKRYGKLAGITEEKLTLPTLRHTAALLRIEMGDDLEQMQDFLDIRVRDSASAYLRRLPVLERGERQLMLVGVKLPERTSYPKITHGLYANRQPPEELAAIMEEDIQSLEEAIQGMNFLAEGLLEFSMRDDISAKQELQLSDACTKAAARAADLIKADRQFQALAKEEAQAAQDMDLFLSRMEEVDQFIKEKAAKQEGAPPEQAPPGQALPAELPPETPPETLPTPEQEPSQEDEPPLPSAAQILQKSIARTWLILRRTFHSAQDCQQVEDFIRYTEIYSRACHRLVRLMKVAKLERGTQENWLSDTINAALEEVRKEWEL